MAQSRQSSAEEAQSRLNAQRRRRGRGFTFIELMVATVLMTILTGSVVFIFIQAQKIFIAVDAKVQVYQYARYAFDQMERDLANVIRTRDMEFFNDRAPPAGIKGRCDPGEELPIMGTANLDGDPLTGNDIYNYSFTMRQPSKYAVRDDPSTEYFRDSIYFKTVTVVDGETQAALIEYALVDTEKERPKMQKRLWRVTGVDAANPLQPRYELNGGSNEPEKQDLCLYAVESRFEIFVKNMRGSRPGEYYTTQQLIDPPIIDRVSGEKPFEKHRNWWGGGTHQMHQCYYDVTHEGTATPDLGIFQETAPNGPILFRTQRNFGFPMLKEGDRIFLWGGDTGFKAQPYTIKAILRNGNPPTAWEPTFPINELRIQFEEPIEGYQTGRQMEVRYGAGWVPAAVRVTVRIKDAKSLQHRSVARVFKILAR